MSVGEMREINRQYAQKFGNFEKINHPSIAYDVRFATLLKKAIETGQIVSRADVVRAVVEKLDDLLEPTD